MHGQIIGSKTFTDIKQNYCIFPSEVKSLALWIEKMTPVSQANAIASMKHLFLEKGLLR
jgi:hypothetical protein